MLLLLLLGGKNPGCLCPKSISKIMTLRAVFAVGRRYLFWLGMADISM